MKEINIEKIKELVNNTPMSSRELSKRSGIARTSLRRLRDGESDWDNVPLKTLKGLQSVVNDEYLNYSPIKFNVRDYSQLIKQLEDKNFKSEDVLVVKQRLVEEEDRALICYPFIKGKTKLSRELDELDVSPNEVYLEVVNKNMLLRELGMATGAWQVLTRC